jgi:hypothetical protein
MTSVRCGEFHYCRSDRDSDSIAVDVYGEYENKIWRIFKVEMTQNSTIRIAKTLDEGKEWMIGNASREVEK